MKNRIRSAALLGVFLLPYNAAASTYECICAARYNEENIEAYVVEADSESEAIDALTSDSCPATDYKVECCAGEGCLEEIMFGE